MAKGQGVLVWRFAPIRDPAPSSPWAAGHLATIVEIAFAFFLVLTPGARCLERQAFEGSLPSCLLLGQLAAVPWIESHPKWLLHRYRCGLVDPTRVARGA